MSHNSGIAKQTGWWERITQWLGLPNKRHSNREADGLRVLTLEDRRLLAGDVTSVDVTTPGDDLVTDEDVGANTFVVEVNFNAAMQTDSFSGDPGAVGPKLLFSNGGGALPGLANGAGATLTAPTTVWSNGDMTAQITFDVVDQDVDIANIAIDVVDVLDAGANPQNPYTPNSQDFSIDTASTAVRIDNSVVIAQNEGDSAPAVTTYTFDLTRTGGPNNLQVAYTVVGFGPNQATASDFGGVLPSGTAQFNGAQLTTQISIDVTQDLLVENNEQFQVVLTDSASIVLTQATAVGQITNDDAATLAINDVTLAEGDAGTTAFTFTVTLNANVDSAFAVNYQSADDSAIAGQDYTAASGTLNFAGTLNETQQFTVNVTGEQLVELDEQFFANLSGIAAGGRNVTLADSQGVGAINNDDAATLSIDDVTLAEGDAGTTAFTFTVTLNANVDSAFAVNYQSADDSAIAGQDYTAASGTLNFAGTLNETQQFTVNVTGEQLVELDEQFFANLSGIAAGGRNVTLADSQGAGAITNDDAATLSIDDVTLAEGNAGTTAFTFTVTLNANVDSAFAVNYQSADDSAIAGQDYTAASGTLNFAGTLNETQQFTVNVTGEQLVELDEQFFANLSGIAAGGRNVTLADSQGAGAITNDDAATLSIDDVTLAEGNAGTTAFTFTVTLNANVDSAFAVNYQSADDSAIAGQDYTATSGTLNFAGTQNETQQFTVNVTGEQLVELDEQFFANLSGIAAGGRNVTLADSQGAGAITNDDAATLSIDDVTLAEGNAGMTAFTFTVTLNADVAAGFTVNYQSANDSAIAGQDYTADSGTLNFTGTQNETQQFTINATGDQLVELNEQFFANLSGIVGSGLDVTFADSQGAGAITNDDAATLSINDVTLAEGNAGLTAYTFTVTLNANVDSAFTVNYQSANDSAVAGQDYTAASGTLNFAGTQNETQPIFHQRERRSVGGVG